MKRVDRKVTFKRKGWTYRSAAPVLGVTYQYLCDVLNGQRESRRLMSKVDSLPPRRTLQEAQ